MLGHGTAICIHGSLNGARGGVPDGYAKIRHKRPWVQSTEGDLDGCTSRSCWREPRDTASHFVTMERQNVRPLGWLGKGSVKQQNDNSISSSAMFPSERPSHSLHSRATIVQKRPQKCHRPHESHQRRRKGSRRLLRPCSAGPSNNSKIRGQYLSSVISQREGIFFGDKSNQT